MTTSTGGLGHVWPLEKWHESLATALSDGAIEAVPVIFVDMARDGWGHEAETARRLMAAPRSIPLGELLGHDANAAKQLAIMRDAYQAGGLDVLRSTADALVKMASDDAVARLLVETVLTLSEKNTSGGAWRAWEDFERADALQHAEDVRQGGNA